MKKYRLNLLGFMTCILSLFAVSIILYFAEKMVVIIPTGIVGLTLAVILIVYGDVTVLEKGEL